MNYRYFSLFFLIASPSLLAEEYLSLVSIGFSQSSSDYYADGASEIKPNNYSLSMVQQISSNWVIGFDYGKKQGDGRWLNQDDLQIDLFNQAKIDSKSLGISAVWLGDSFDLNFSIGSGNSQDISRSVLPSIEEVVDIDDKTFDISIDKSIELSSENGENYWEFDFGLGVQYARVDLSISDRINIDPPTMIDSQISQTNLSALLDFSVTYRFEETHLTWAPFLSASWNAELSANGEQVVLISRGDEVRTSDQLTERFATSFRIPDSGFWSAGLNVSWDNGWSSDLSYARNVSTNYKLERVSFAVSVIF